MPAAPTSTAPTLAIRTRDDGGLTLEATGSWTLQSGIPALDDAFQALGRASALTLDGSGVEDWDSGLVQVTIALRAAARDRGIPFDAPGLAAGVIRLADLAEAVPEKTDARRGSEHLDLLTRIGMATVQAGAGIRTTATFIGELTLSFGRMLRGKGVYRKQDLLLMLQRAGMEALSISALVAFLLGLILAFIGAIQLQKFGATIFVADLVGIGMVRDMGALMTAIVMAGRSGAAYAAEIGSMKATQEVDALETTGVSPMDFLVLPRVIAITAMMPLLTVFADVVGVFGGLFVSWAMLDIGPSMFLQQATRAVTMGHFFGGLVKGTAYGLLVGIAGCMRGLQAGSSSLAVGAAATSAVVTGIIWVIAACGLFQLLQYVLGI
jgi:phospholipid/cholesterol/gamma-HCH transport system permease protein